MSALDLEIEMSKGRLKRAQKEKNNHHINFYMKEIQQLKRCKK